MRGHRVGEPARVVNPRQRGKNLRRDLHVEFDVLIEFIQDGTHQRLALLVGKWQGFKQRHLRGKVIFRIQIILDHGPPLAFNQHLHGAIGQFQQLQNAGDGSDGMDAFRCRIVVGGALLRHQHDLLAGLHGLLERAYGLASADKQRDDHVREHHDIAQRQHGDVRFRSWNDHGGFGFLHFRLKFL